MAFRDRSGSQTSGVGMKTLAWVWNKKENSKYQIPNSKEIKPMKPNTKQRGYPRLILFGFFGI
jgi:hypothetical protein